MRPYILSWICFLSIFPLSAFAGNLDEIALMLLKGSNGYRSDSLSVVTLTKSMAAENNLPDPQLGGEYLVAPPDEANRWAAELSWEIEWPGVYNAKGKETDKRIQLARQNLYAKNIDKLSEIKSLLLDYILCKKKLELLEELSCNNDSIYRLAEKAAQGGEITALDLNKIRLEYANIRTAKAGIINEEATIEGNLSEIFGQDPFPILQQLDCNFPEIHIPGETEIMTAGIRSAALKSAKTETEVARLNKKTVSMEALPSLSVGYKHAYEEGIHFNGALLGISIPIFSSRGKQKAAKAAITEAEYNEETTKLSAETSARQLLKQLIVLKNQIDEIEPLLKNSDHNTLLLKAYEGGIMTLIEYIAERNYYTNAGMELLSLQHAAALTQSHLTKYVDSPDF